ncbi:ABC transporter ATP-binding protein [Candidatus Spongiisocius sp.]|uniref:ABC transporter ATP-binding protein n=1 Tax=Candidatus Spongiisocius sp. TaxID=3101273 RepID=UPI003B591203
MIRLHEVTRVYATGGVDVRALAGVSLEIDRGEFVAIMGQSGSGKSTLMNIIGLLDRPTSGEYLLAGRDVERFSEDARSRLRGNAFGFVFQSYNLLPRLTALEQVELPLIYQRAPDRRRRAAEALVRVGLADRIMHLPNELSGGGGGVPVLLSSRFGQFLGLAGLVGRLGLEHGQDDVAASAGDADDSGVVVFALGAFA